MGKVYGYCRTALADENEIIKRTELIKRYCEDNCLSLKKCFCDNGVSGFDIGEGFNQLMCELESGDMVLFVTFHSYQEAMRGCKCLWNSLKIWELKLYMSMQERFVYHR